MSYRSSRGNRSEDVWSIRFSFPDKKDSLYSQLIIKKAFSMNTKSKFRFINQIIMNDAKEESELQLTFNRFESQRFSDSINKKEKEPSKDKPRPLFVQFMEQIDTGNLHKLKVHRGNPFRVDLHRCKSDH
ncbi:hypothetical protein M9Y10_035665 [Tritrichomonas musculus]|uniref:Uncharacterized protein n=1 Tax=Tritrichomonas musculus TaxID=1915356 RepID=A0ABR2GWD3_9EUKA